MKLYFTIALMALAGVPKANASIPFMNGIDYLNQLKAERPELFTGDPKASSCRWDVRVRPAYRDLILVQKQDVKMEGSLEGTFVYTYLDEPFTLAKQKADFEWASTHRAAMAFAEQTIASQMSDKGYKVSPYEARFEDGDREVYNEESIPGDPREPARMQLPKLYDIYPTFYPLADYVSYGMGPRDIVFEKQANNAYSLVYKIWFEFKDYAKDLTPEAYLKFSEALHKAGFSGDSKLTLPMGWARYFYINIAVHAPTMKDAKIAESVGLTFFGDKLESYSRGVDYREPNKAPISWPTFLCTHDVNTLPGPVLNFVNGK